ncbi:MAG: type IX secretion system membrane protein PorP/SprF [Bacteroidales bacterium]|nr:type IX secretion system membrane protein PorP/SprF [Bacteroidales bacterium]
MRKWLLIISFIVSGTFAEAQLEPLSNQYLLNNLAINPACAGSREALSVTMLHRNQWTGFEGSPKTVTLAVHSPMRNEKIGLGLLAVNDRFGISRSTCISGNFAYKIRMQQGILSFGLSGGLTIASNTWSELVAIDLDDALLLGNTPGYLLPNFSAGTYYYTDRLFIGLSIPMFLSHNFNPSTQKFDLVNDYSEYNYLVNAGYLFKISDNWKVLPSILIRFNPGSAVQMDLNTYVIYRDKIWAGFSYRSNKSIVGLFMYQVNNQLSVAYTYDMGFGIIAGYMGGSHEIMIRYDFRYIINVISPRYF